MSLVIIDTGCANLSSVAFAFERIGVNGLISDDPETIRSADRVVLPGVGAAPFAMRNIRAKGLEPVIKDIKQPMIGICLGMQLLFDTLTEGGQGTQGLGLVKGHITRLDVNDMPLPHMGWNSLEIVRQSALLEGIEPGDYAYFVHSFAAPVSPATVATTTYGHPFSAVIAHKNVYGCQFHPERSSRTGAKILQNFMGITS